MNWIGICVILVTLANGARMAVQGLRDNDIERVARGNLWVLASTAISLGALLAMKLT